MILMGDSILKCWGLQILITIYLCQIVEKAVAAAVPQPQYVHHALKDTGSNQRMTPAKVNTILTTVIIGVLNKSS